MVYAATVGGHFEQMSPSRKRAPTRLAATFTTTSTVPAKQVSFRLFTDLPTTLLERLITDPHLDAWDLTSFYQASYPFYPKLCKVIESSARLLLRQTSIGSYLYRNPISENETSLSILRYLTYLPPTAYSSALPSEHQPTSTCVWSCGRNDFGQGVRTSDSDINTLQPCFRLPSENLKMDQPPPHIVSIAAGGSHSACITMSGTLFIAGSLGIHDYISIAKNYWQPVVSLKRQAGRISFVSCGHSHIAVLNAEGQLFMKGNNAKGQLGTGDYKHRLDFHRVDLFTNTCATATQSVVTPLEKQYNVNGDSNISNIVHTSVEMVATGRAHSICLLKDGTVYCSGDNSRGQLCLNNSTIRSTNTFQKINLESYGKFYVKRIACGPDSTFLLTNTNMILITGKRPNGSLSVIGGLGGPRTEISHLSVGEKFAIVRTQSGIVAFSSRFKDFQIPSQFQQFRSIHQGTVDVDAGLGHFVIVYGDGTVKAAGKNAFGQVAAGQMGLMMQGIYSRIFKTWHVPLSQVVSVPDGYQVLQVAAGCYHSLYLLAKKEEA